MTIQTTPEHQWTPPAQRIFIEALAQTGSVAQACFAAGKSRRAAYDLRLRAAGAAFRIGWDAAILVARARLVDDLMERAIEGQEDVIIRDPDAHMVTRRRHDNRLAMSLLSRLDRMAQGDLVPGSDDSVVRTVSQDFEAFLALIERGETGAGAALFVAARTPGLIGDEQCEVMPKDGDGDAPVDDPTPEAAAARMNVWFDPCEGDWVTNFPPPGDWYGHETGNFGDGAYRRDLSEVETQIHDSIRDAALIPLRMAGAAARDRYFVPVALAVAVAVV